MDSIFDEAVKKMLANSKNCSNCKYAHQIFCDGEIKCSQHEHSRKKEELCLSYDGITILDLLCKYSSSWYMQSKYVVLVQVENMQYRGIFLNIKRNETYKHPELWTISIFMTGENIQKEYTKEKINNGTEEPIFEFKKITKEVNMINMYLGNEPIKDSLAISGLGLTGEAGEVADLLKKHIGHGHELNKEKLSKELGDVLWYLSNIASCFEIDLNDVAKTNIDKLKKRYPKGFNASDSIKRVDVKPFKE